MQARWIGYGLFIFLTGCGTVRGPGIELVAPRVSGQVVDAETGSPLAGVRVGRALYGWKGPGGEFRKSGEDLLLLQSYKRSDASGAFDLPSQRAALLFRLGDLRLNLRLTLQKSGYAAWQTKFPYSALGTNDSGAEVRLETGPLKLERK